MALTIGDDAITRDRTAHPARLLADDQHQWEVSWLPGRSMDRNSAITAMVLADVTGPGDLRAGDRLWVDVEGWAAELGLTARHVLAQTSSSPGWARPDKNGLPADPEAAG